MTETDVVITLNLPDKHCNSCHEDDDAGYDMCCIEVDGEYVDVCCVVAQNFHAKKGEKE